MRYLLTFFIIVLLSILQTTVFEFNLLFSLILIISFYWSPTWALLWAFLAGFLLDVLGGGRLGITPLGLLLSLMVLVICRQRFSLQHPLSCFIVSLFTYLIFSIVTQRTISLSEGVILAFLVAGFQFFSRPALGVKR